MSNKIQQMIQQLCPNGVEHEQQLRTELDAIIKE